MLEKLTKPWNRSVIKWRVGSVSKKGDKAMPLAYVDARTVMERLDTAVGIENWQDRYEFHNDRTVCYLSIRINEEWITKSDGAGDSRVEAEKGGISDAFKRAAVKWGMGRELYAIKCRWMPINNYKQLVGDAWEYVMSGAAEDEPEEDGKIGIDDDVRNDAKLEFLKQINEKLDKVTSLDALESCLTEKEKSEWKKLPPIEASGLNKRYKELEEMFKRQAEEELHQQFKNA